MNLSVFDIYSPTMILTFRKGENIESAIPVDIEEVDTNMTHIKLV